MVHFVLKDINPNKVGSFEAFLKEMNDITVLITVASAPFITAKLLNESDDFDVIEDGYKAVFKGHKKDGEIMSGKFQLFQEKKCLIEISFTVGEIQPIALRAKLNCDGEYLAKKELEKAFHRDFSHQAHQYMKMSLQDLEKEKEETIPTIEELEAIPITEDLVEKQDPDIAKTQNGEINTATTETEVDEEFVEDVTEEIETLSQKVLQSIDEVNEIIEKLNNLCHDITRGASIDFSKLELKEQTLENGAIVQMIDEEENGYKITFRKGMLGDTKEISFFLELKDDLIFSIYLSSLGKGSITASAEQSHITIKKVKDQLL